MSDAGGQAQQPLQGVRVVDLTTSYAGPTATMMLAELGAEVIKVERPGTGDESRSWGPPFVGDVSAWFASANRGKRSIALDIASPADREVLDALLATADVLVESFNPVKLASMGLDPSSVTARFPRLIYCAISGFGFGGPDTHLPGYDLIAQARSGIMSVTGAAGGSPQRVSTALSDISAGVFAALAVSSALHGRATTGAGCFLDVSLLDADVALMAPRLVSFISGEPEPKPSGGTDSVLAIYQTFETKDQTLAVAIGNDAMWKRFCVAIGLNGLADDPDLATNARRRALRSVLVATIAERLAQKSATDWVELLREAAVPCAPVQGLSGVVADPQLIAREALGWASTSSSDRVGAVRLPWRINGIRPPARSVPDLNAHEHEIRAELASVQLTPGGAVT